MRCMVKTIHTLPLVAFCRPQVLCGVMEGCRGSEMSIHTISQEGTPGPIIAPIH